MGKHLVILQKSLLIMNNNDNENYQAVAKKHAGGNGNLTINFAWPYDAMHRIQLSKQFIL